MYKKPIFSYNRHMQVVYVYFLSKLAMSCSTKIIDIYLPKWYYYAKKGVISIWL